MDRFGYAKTIDASTYERNKETIEAEFKYSFVMKNTGKVCLFTSAGNLHTIKAMGKRFEKEDENMTLMPEKEEAILKALPGNNCGACGYPGCDGYAAAVAAGQGMP